MDIQSGAVIPFVPKDVLCDVDVICLLMDDGGGGVSQMMEFQIRSSNLGSQSFEMLSQSLVLDEAAVFIGSSSALTQPSSWMMSIQPILFPHSNPISTPQPLSSQPSATTNSV